MKQSARTLHQNGTVQIKPRVSVTVFKSVMYLPVSRPYGEGWKSFSLAFTKVQDYLKASRMCFMRKRVIGTILQLKLDGNTQYEAD